MTGRLPDMPTGTTGTPVLMARTKAPFLKAYSLPSGDRVPSGKRIMVRDSSLTRSAARSRDAMACLRSARFTEMCPQILHARPNIGMRESSSFATKRPLPGSAAKSANTSNQDW